MKKLLLACTAIMLLTGCTKNYKTVDEYETAMKAVRDSQPAYTIEVKQGTSIAELYYKNTTKGNKWKTEMSMNGGKSYMTTMLYDGSELLQYSANSPYAVSNPALDASDDEETKNSMLEMLNPVSPVFSWKDGYSMFAALSDSEQTAEFTNNKANMNGFDCRMIKFGEDREACVSDKYGIAVYEKMKYEDPRRGTEEITFNVVKIDTADVPDSSFELPKGIEKMDFDKMLNNLSSMKQYE